MLPRNFPERANDRRRKAGERIAARLALGTRRVGVTEVALTRDDIARLNREADTLALRVKPNARAIRTKKTPKSTWSAARKAWRAGKID